MSNHATYSPSSLESREICPGWENRGGDSPAAAEGTKMHLALETGDYAGLEEEQIKAVQAVADIFEHYIEELGPNPTVVRECKLTIRDLTWGTADLVAIAGDKAFIGDAKFGWVSVDSAETNIQGWAYTLGLWQANPQVENVTVCFAQPRRDEVDVHTFNRQRDMKRMLLRVATIIARCKKHTEADLRPDESNCIYCAHLATCKPVHTKALVITKGYMTADSDLPALFDPAQLATPDLRSQAERLRKVLEKWCEAVASDNLQYRMAGNEIPGFEIKFRKGDRQITDAQIAWDIASQHITADEFAACSKVSVAQLEKAISDKAPRGQKGKAMQALEDELTDRGALSQGGERPQLVRIKERKLESIES